MRHKRPRKRYDAVKLTPEEINRFHCHVPSNLAKPTTRKGKLHDTVNPFHVGLNEVRRDNIHGSKAHALAKAWNGHPHLGEVCSCEAKQREDRRIAKFENSMRMFYRQLGEPV